MTENQNLPDFEKLDLETLLNIRDGLNTTISQKQKEAEKSIFQDMGSTYIKVRKVP